MNISILTGNSLSRRTVKRRKDAERGRASGAHRLRRYGLDENIPRQSREDKRGANIRKPSIVP